MRTALNVTGIKLEQVQRGQVIGAVGALFETKIFDATVRWIKPPKHGMRVRLSIGAAEVMARVFLNDYTLDIIQLFLEKTVAVALDQPYILRSYSPQEVIGGGRVLVPEAKKRKKSEKTFNVQRKNNEEVIMDLLKQSPQGIFKTEVFRVLGKDPMSLSPLIAEWIETEQIFDFAGLWFDIDSFKLCVQKLLTALAQIHDQEPKQAYLAREKVLEVAGLNWSGKPLEKILQTLAVLHKIKLKGTQVALDGFQVKLTDRQEKFILKVALELEKSGPNVPNPREIAFLLKVPIQAVDTILRLGLESGKWVKIAEDIYYTMVQIEVFRNTVKELSIQKNGFSAADVRDVLKTSRKYAVPLLEYFDKLGFTTRVEDLRYLNEE